jgi:hypothetical protein
VGLRADGIVTEEEVLECLEGLVEDAADSLRHREVMHD